MPEFGGNGIDAIGNEQVAKLARIVEQMPFQQLHLAMEGADRFAVRQAVELCARAFQRAAGVEITTNVVLSAGWFER